MWTPHGRVAIEKETRYMYCRVTQKDDGVLPSSCKCTYCPIQFMPIMLYTLTPGIYNKNVIPWLLNNSCRATCTLKLGFLTAHTTHLS